jgi:hypothetical protein
MSKSAKVFAECTMMQGTSQQKPASAKHVDKCVTYDRWEMFDDDFTLFYNVVLGSHVNEKVFTEAVVVLAGEVPNGAVVLSEFKSATPPAALNAKMVEAAKPPKQADGGAVYALAQQMVKVHGVSFPEAMRLAKIAEDAKLLSRPCTNADAGTAVGAASASPSKEASPPAAAIARSMVDYVECNVSRVMGPFDRGAKFDIMAFNGLTKEGVVHRNNSERYYVLSFDERGGEVPRLVRDFTKQKIPPCFRNISFGAS